MADSLIFGDIEISEGSGDASGTELWLEIANDSVRGTVRVAAGEPSEPIAPYEFAYDALHDSLHYSYTTGGRTVYVVRAHVACSGIAGTLVMRTFPWRGDDLAGEDTVAFSLPRRPTPF